MRFFEMQVCFSNTFPNHLCLLSAPMVSLKYMSFIYYSHSLRLNHFIPTSFLNKLNASVIALNIRLLMQILSLSPEPSTLSGCSIRMYFLNADFTWAGSCTSCMPRRCQLWPGHKMSGKVHRSTLTWFLLGVPIHRVKRSSYVTWAECQSSLFCYSCQKNSLTCSTRVFSYSGGVGCCCGTYAPKFKSPKLSIRPDYDDAGCDV